MWAGKVRVIQQMEASECGVACLSMLLDYHGQARTLPEMRELCGTSRDGTSALALLKAARQLGLKGRGVTAKRQALAALQKPAILHWAANHFVVLESCQRDGVTVVDPANGRRRVSADEVTRLFSGVALELQPGPEFQKRKRKSLGSRRYAAAIKDQRSALIFVGLANATQHLLAVAAPAAGQLLIDHVIQPSKHEWLLPVILVLLSVALAQIVLQRLQGVSQSVLHASLGMILAREMGDRLLRLPLPFLESRGHGDLMERVNTQGALQSLLAHTVQALFDVFFVCLLIGLMLTYDPFLGAVSLALTTARIGIMRWVRRPVAQRMAAELAARGRESSALVEATFAIEMTKGFGVEQQLRTRFAERVRERVGWGMQSARLESGLGRAMSVLDATMHAMILWFGGRQVIAGEMSIGIFSGFLAIRSMLVGPMASVVSLMESWIRIRGVLERCDDILSMPPVREEGRVTAAVSGRLELVELGFRFGSGGPWVVRNVSLTIEPGEHVAIVGASGQGKSTLGKLISGLLEPTEGRVLLDGRDIREYERGALARCFGVVLQEPLIMEGPVREALVIRNPQCSHREMVEAAELACFDEVVRRLPSGYDSKLEALGKNLSGGERQRLALAQALLQRPRVLLLDEGTCSLDPALEERVMTGISRLGATLLSVAHRQAVVRYATRVLCVRDARVVELSLESLTASDSSFGPGLYAQRPA